MLGDAAFQVHVGRRDDARVHMDRSRRADRPHLALLQHAKQLDLQRRRRVADLVEEHGAAMRLLEHTLVVGDRTGEGAADMAEQLRLEECLGERAAVRRRRTAGSPAGCAGASARAISSLPVPLSPVTSTGADESAAYAICL